MFSIGHESSKKRLLTFKIIKSKKVYQKLNLKEELSQETVP